MACFSFSPLSRAGVFTAVGGVAPRSRAPPSARPPLRGASALRSGPATAGTLAGSTAKPLTRPRPLAPSAPNDRLHFGGRSRRSSVPPCERSRVAFAWRHAGAPLRFAVRSSRFALRTRGKTHHLRAGWSWCYGRGRLGLRRGTSARGSMARPTACALLPPLHLRCSYSYYEGRRGRGFGTFRRLAGRASRVGRLCSADAPRCLRLLGAFAEHNLGVSPYAPPTSGLREIRHHP